MQEAQKTNDAYFLDLFGRGVHAAALDLTVSNPFLGIPVTRITQE